MAVTIEVSNSATGGEWPVGDKAYRALIELCVDVCKRNGIAKLTFDGTPKGSLTHHSMFANTSCPGKYLLDRFGAICDEVNKRLSVQSTPTPTASTTDFKVGDIVQFTGGGVYLSSTTHAITHTRNASRCKVTQTAMKARNQYHLISEDGGGVHGWVLSEDIKAIGAAAPAPAPAPALATPDKKSIDEIAREGIRGDWGNGA
ncbi:MAG: N-acetylmuramoyl-L-alanine amidase, partial [Oscillospiraceae bacterium]|nr:N-acetylmuramoyl-L-alanine amidase [Oscillospiraceae bacterium]